MTATPVVLSDFVFCRWDFPPDGAARAQRSRDAIDITSQPKALERPDQVAGDVKLPPVQPVKSGARECVVVVMPALAETQQTHDPLVVALIVGLELALAKGVTDRIDAPGDVMSQENAHQSAPQQTAPTAYGERNNQRQHCPYHKCAADKHNHSIVDQVAAIDIRIGLLAIEDPAHMCVKKAIDGTMWIALAVRLRVMLDMRGSPIKRRPF